MVGTLVMAPKSVTFRRHDHLVSVLFGDLLSHSYNITFSMFLYLVIIVLINRGSDHMYIYFKRQFIDMFSKKGYRDSKSESTIR